MTKSLCLVWMITLAITGCSAKSESETREEIPETIDSLSTDNLDRLKPEELFFLVEGAVDSWLFYHLHDYRSYEPIIRSTDYDADTDTYLHHIRYRASTLGGGYETEDKTFRVSLVVTDGTLKDFNVEDLSPYRSITEK